MKIFTIDNDTNNITVHTTAQDAEVLPNAQTFRSEAGLGKLATDWPATQLVEIWNSLPGVVAVNKFKDRATAVTRIWKTPDAGLDERGGDYKAVWSTCRIRGHIGPQAADVATTTPQENSDAKTSRSALRSPIEAKPREASKTAQVIAMLKRKDGATLEEIMTAMKWQSTPRAQC